MLAIPRIRGKDAAVVIPPPGLDLNFAQGRMPGGSGLSFSRSTVATVVNGAGLIESAAINAPRIGYCPTTRACCGLQIEEARTNLIVYSNDFTQASWGVQNASFTASSGTSPDGTNNASLLKPSSGNTAHVGYASTFAVTANKTYTFSVWVKASGYNFVGLSYHDSNPTAGHESIRVFDLANGVQASAYNVTPSFSQIEAYPNGWYRLTISSQFATTLANVGLWPLNADTDPRAGFLANGTSGILHYGWQFELGDRPTSYIPTSSAAVTRAAEPCYNSIGGKPTLDFNPTEGTVLVEFFAYSLVDPQGGAQRTVWELAQNTDRSTGKVALYVYEAARGITFDVTTAGYTTVASLRTPFTALVKHQVATRYRKQNYALKKNAVPIDLTGAGGMSSPTADVTLQGATRLAIGSFVNGVSDSYLNGFIQRIRYWPQALPNLMLQRLVP